MSEILNLTNLKNLFSNRRNGLVTFLNPHSVAVASKDGKFREIIEGDTYLCIDGVGLLMAHKIFNYQAQVKRVTGRDAFNELLKHNLTVSFLCSSDFSRLELKRMANNLLLGRINAVSFITLPQLDNDQNMCDFVTGAAFKPADVVCLGISSPKQDKLAAMLVSKHPNTLFLSIGAVLSFVTGVEKQAPWIFQKIGLEWLYRFVHHPTRMVGRLFTSILVFPMLVLTRKFSISKMQFLK